MFLNRQRYDELGRKTAENVSEELARFGIFSSGLRRFIAHHSLSSCRCAIREGHEEPNELLISASPFGVRWLRGTASREAAYRRADSDSALVQAAYGCRWLHLRWCLIPLA